MFKQVIIPLMLVAVLIAILMVGGFTSFAQMNIQKVGEEGVVKPVQEAQEKQMQQLAEGMAQTAPAGDTSGEEGAPEPIPLEEIPEEALRDAIRAAAGFDAFADLATKTVRSYIRKIKVGPKAFEQEFDPGNEPWRSEKAELRYSPFDPQIVSQQAPDIRLKPVEPFLPPIRVKATGPGLDVLKALVKLRMTTKSGDQYIALAEIAGYPVQLKVGSKLEIPPEVMAMANISDIFIDEISLNSVLFRSGNQSVLIPFAEAAGSEERPFEIEVTR